MQHSELILSATDKLTPRAVLTNSANSFFGPNYPLEGDTDQDERFEAQTMKGYSGDVNWSLDEDAGLYTYLFKPAFGLRFLDKHQEETDENYNTAQIEAFFHCIFVSKTELSKEEIDAFAERHVFHVAWPYWREHVQSTCMKAGIAPIPIPFHMLNK
jgi:hypothetical protein